MKTNWTLQKEGEEITVKETEKKVADVIKSMGYKKKEIEAVDFYFKAEDGIVYFVAQMTEGKTISGQL